jgi:ParB family chromosome partitioning protein
MRRSAALLRAAPAQPKLPKLPKLPKVFTLADLCVSPLNVRTNQEDTEATDALEASILKTGLFNPLLVHPLSADGAAPWGVLAGGRRLRAIRRLVDRGDLPSDWPVLVRVIGDLNESEITELSLSENLLRRDLRSYEVHAAVRQAHEQGATPEEIAARCGQRLTWVRQQLRLAALAPEIFQVYARGEIGIDMAEAYAATEDQDLQRAAFRFWQQAQEWNRTPSAVRSWLKIGDREALRLLRYVGEEAYLAAGGTLDRDLFHQGPELTGVRVANEELLRRLSEKKLGAARDLYRARAGRPELRFLAEPPRYVGGVDTSIEIHPGKEGRKILLPAGDVAATIAVDDDGQPQVRWWWASRKAKAEAERQANGSEPPKATVRQDLGFADRYSGDAQQARAALREEHGLTADGVQVVRSLRTEMLRALLVDDAAQGGSLGADYFIWAQLRMELNDKGTDRDTPRTIGVRDLTSSWQSAEDMRTPDVAVSHLDANTAHAIWTSLIESIRKQPFIGLKDPIAAFAEFVAADRRLKSFAGAVCAGLALLRSANVPGFRIPIHDGLAAMAGGHDAHLRSLWQPTPEFMAMFPKNGRLAIAEPYVDPEVFRNWAKLDSSTLSRATSALFTESMECAAAHRGDTAAWVHPLLSFGAAAPADQPVAGGG